MLWNAPRDVDLEVILVQMEILAVFKIVDVIDHLIWLKTIPKIKRNIFQELKMHFWFSTILFCLIFAVCVNRTTPPSWIFGNICRQ